MTHGLPLLLDALFGAIAATTVAGALMAVLSTRIIHGVAGLALCCVGLAGLYYYLNSPFLALMEILIYVGAVCVTIVFGVMLSETDEPSQKEKRSRRWAWGGAALLASAAIFLGVAKLGFGTGPLPAAVPAQSDGSVRAIGLSLLTSYSLPFELISLVLLVAILGALVIARGGRGSP
jgi:NADH-quinone oxidoreductase subunit J